MDSKRLLTISAAGLGRLYREGAIDPVAATEFFLERAASEALRDAFIRLTPERARAEAKASAERHRAGRPLGPLDGVPVAWKDLFDVAGTPTTAASAARRDVAPATSDAPAVRNLTAAGAICLGKTNLTEFAFSGLGLNPSFGTPKNPWSRDVPRIPGGSSSGSAVAVAAGAAPCGIGTDTSGSVRVPAALNGLVGYKPTHGRIDLTGVFPLSATLDSVGPLVRTVEDAILVEAGLRGAVAAIGAASVSGATFVVPDTVVFDEVQPDIRNAFDAALAALAKAGAKIVRRRIHALEESKAVMAEHGTIVAAEALYVHHDLLHSPAGEKIDPNVRKRILAAKALTAYNYVSLVRAREKLRTRLAEELGGGLMLCPAVPHGAPEIAPLEESYETWLRINMLTLRNTMLGSYLEMPGVTLPIGCDSKGLPMSLLVSSIAGDDDRVLGIAWGMEKVLAAAGLHCRPSP